MRLSAKIHLDKPLLIAGLHALANLFQLIWLITFGDNDVGIGVAVGRSAGCEPVVGPRVGHHYRHLLEEEFAVCGDEQGFGRACDQVL